MIVYFDENIPPHLAKGFNLIQQPENLKQNRTPIDIKNLSDEFGKGARDIEWIPSVGKRKAFVITQDINITRRKDELNALRENGLGLFILRGKSKKCGLSVWEMLITLSKNWEDLVSIMLTQKDAFAYEFKMNGKPKKLK